VSFVTLTFLEIVLASTTYFLSVLVERLPKVQRASARMLGLGFAMLTASGCSSRSPGWRRCAIVVSRARHGRFRPRFDPVRRRPVPGGETVMEITHAEGQSAHPQAGVLNSYVLIILQIGIIDIVFSLDRCSRGGSAKHIEIMIAHRDLGAGDDGCLIAISRFIDRYPTIKVLALAFLYGRRGADRRIAGTGLRRLSILRDGIFVAWNG